MEENKKVYVIQNEEGLFATYGRSEFRKDLRFARLYKSKKTALKYYFDYNGNYEKLTLVELEIKIINTEKLNAKDFYENKGE